MRTCGSCTACCTVMGVDEIQKPERQRCPHLCSSGCSTYEKRPETCSSWSFDWLLGSFEEADKPDIIGIVSTRQVVSPLNRTMRVFREVERGSRFQPRAAALVERVVREDGELLLWVQDGNMILSGRTKA